jgi:hypothetical protein
MSKNRVTVNGLHPFDEEAQCSDEESDEQSSDGSVGSLQQFVVRDDAPLEKTSQKTVTLPARKWTRKTPQTRAVERAKAAVGSKPPGHSSFPCNEFSLTITRSKADVALDSLDAVALFMEKHCIKGAVSTEIGQRAFQLHLQGVLRLHWPRTKERVQELQKFIKGILPQKGKQYKVLLKPLQGGQNFIAMIGYVTKDSGERSELYLIDNLLIRYC